MSIMFMSNASRHHNASFRRVRAVLAPLWFVGLFALFGYSVASIPSGIIASAVVVIGALLAYHSTTQRRSGRWHVLGLGIVLTGMVGAVLPLIDRARDLRSILQFIFMPADIGVLLLGGLAVVGSLMVVDVVRNGGRWTQRIMLGVLVPLSVFLIAHPLADWANGVPQSWLPMLAGGVLLLLVIWRLWSLRGTRTPRGQPKA